MEFDWRDLEIGDIVKFKDSYIARHYDYNIFENKKIKINNIIESAGKLRIYFKEEYIIISYNGCGYSTGDSVFDIIELKEN
jgi:hypothetical protein